MSESSERVHVGVQVPIPLRERIEAAADREDRTLSSWIRTALRRRLDAEERVREDAAPRSQ